MGTSAPGSGGRAHSPGPLKTKTALENTRKKDTIVLCVILSETANINRASSNRYDLQFNLQEVRAITTIAQGASNHYDCKGDPAIITIAAVEPAITTIAKGMW